MRAGHRADDVEGVLDVGDPVAHRLVERVLQRLRSRLHRHDRGAQQFHPVDVLRLPLDVFGAHVDHALEAVAGGRRWRGHPVLAGAGLGDHARLAHPPREQRLADGVVDLVRAGVVQVLALEVDLRAADLFRPAPRVVDGTRPADELRELVVEFGDEFRIVAVALRRRRAAPRARGSASRRRTGRHRGRNGLRHPADRRVSLAVRSGRLVRRRTASTNGSILATSFPRRTSAWIPLDVSTANGPSRSIAAPTFAASMPPETMSRLPSSWGPAPSRTSGRCRRNRRCSCRAGRTPPRGTPRASAGS